MMPAHGLDEPLDVLLGGAIDHHAGAGHDPERHQRAIPRQHVEHRVDSDDDLFQRREIRPHAYPDQFIGLLFNHLTAKAGTVTGKHYNHARYLQQKREMIELWARHLETVIGGATADVAKDNVVSLVRRRSE